MDKMLSPLHYKAGITLHLLCLSSLNYQSVFVLETVDIGKRSKKKKKRKNQQPKNKKQCMGDHFVHRALGRASEIPLISLLLTFSHRPCSCTEMSGMFGRDEVGWS